jgi:hypothetical protein
MNLEIFRTPQVFFRAAFLLKDLFAPRLPLHLSDLLLYYDSALSYLCTLDLPDIGSHSLKMNILMLTSTRYVSMLLAHISCVGSDSPKRFVMDSAPRIT